MKKRIIIELESKGNTEISQEIIDRVYDGAVEVARISDLSTEIRV